MENIISKIKGFLGLCQFKKCYRRSHSILTVKVTSENKEICSELNINFCKHHTEKFMQHGMDF